MLPSLVATDRDWILLVRGVNVDIVQNTVFRKKEMYRVLMRVGLDNDISSGNIPWDMLALYVLYVDGWDPHRFLVTSKEFHGQLEVGITSKVLFFLNLFLHAHMV